MWNVGWYNLQIFRWKRLRRRKKAKRTKRCYQRLKLWSWRPRLRRRRRLWRAKRSQGGQKRGDKSRKANVGNWLSFSIFRLNWGQSLIICVLIVVIKPGDDLNLTRNNRVSNWAWILNWRPTNETLYQCQKNVFLIEVFNVCQVKVGHKRIHPGYGLCIYYLVSISISSPHTYNG